MHNVAQVQGQLGGARFDIPDLDRVIAGGRCQDVFSGGVEKNVTYLSEGALDCVRKAQGIRVIYQFHSLRVTGKLANRCHILDLIGVKIRAQGEVLRHTPKEDLLCDQSVPMNKAAAVAWEFSEGSYLAVIRSRCNQIIVERVPSFVGRVLR